MWCELVLNGIGGRTIAEAQQRISYPEYIKWIKYRNKRGSLNQGMRIERSSALLATLYANCHRAEGVQKFTIYDFMPHEQERELSLEEAMESWS